MLADSELRGAEPDRSGAPGRDPAHRPEDEDRRPLHGGAPVSRRPRRPADVQDPPGQREHSDGAGRLLPVHRAVAPPRTTRDLPRPDQARFLVPTVTCGCHTGGGLQGGVGSPRSSRTIVAALRPGPADTEPPGWVVAPVW